jgi:hypothetical protein
MFNGFVSAFLDAALSADLRTADALIAAEFNEPGIHLAIGDDPSQPFVVGGWHIAAPDRSRLMLSAALPGHKRADFALIRFGFTIPMLAAYHRAGAPVLGHVNISVEDHRVWPGLSFCHTEAGSLLPDPVFVSTSAYADIRQHYAAHALPWEKRARVAFWRGSTTGRIHGLASWRDLPRVRLCDIAGTRPELFDVGISRVVSLEAHSDELRNAGFIRDYVGEREFHRYRYHIDIDGNSNSWPGLFQKLLTGSPVLKVASPFGFRQWFYNRLIPWVNYVPVQEDMSDLVDNVRWLMAHDEAARMIGVAGRKLALSMECDSEIQAAVGTICAALRGSSWPDFLRESEYG